MIKSKPTVDTVSMTSANTEYSYELPQHTQEFWLKLRAIGYDMKVAMVAGESGTTYFTIRSGEIHKEKTKASKTTLYFQSPEAAMTAEILSFC
jgi:hypothetical protein